MSNGPTILDIPPLPAGETASLSARQGNGPVVEWLQSPFAFVLLCALGALPLAFTAMPPLIDLGGHLGRYAIQVDGGASATLRQWYSYRWSLIPNLGVDLLMQVLAPWLGLEPALKLIVVAIPVVQIAGWLLLARAVHGYVPPTALFTVPLAYSYPFHYGFLNFTLSVALATCFLALWVTLANREGANREGANRDGLWLRWVIFVPLACVLWVAHLAGWAMFCVLAAADEAWRLRSKGLGKLHGREFARAAFRSMILLCCLLAPWLLKLLWPGPSAAHTGTKLFVYAPLSIKVKLFYLIMPVRDRWAIWDVVAALVIFGIIGWGWSSRRFTRNGGLVLAAVCLALLFAIMPDELIGSSFADMRLVPTMLAVGLIAASPLVASPLVASPLAVSPPVHRRAISRPRVFRHPRLVEGLTIAGLVFAGARLTGNGVSMTLFDRQFSQDLAALEAIPRNTRFVSLVVEACHTTYATWNRERRGHLAGYAIGRRHDFSNDQWNIPGQQLLQVHNPAAGEFASDPSQMTTAQACEDKPAMMQLVGRIPMTTRYLWLLDSGPHRAIPGWHPIQFSTDSMVYLRNSFDRQTIATATAASALVPRYDRQ